MFYTLSRFSKLHNFFRVVVHSVLWRIPHSIKYSVGKAFRKNRLPYSVIKSGDTVVQLGAPWDILKAGRSRSITFSMLVGETGRVIVVEPDRQNIDAMNAAIEKHKINNITLVPKGAWDKKGTLRFLSDPKHPAANLIEDVYDEKRTDIENYDVTEIEVDNLDNILRDAGVDDIKLLSVTTNGAELQILSGFTEINRADHLSVIGDKKDFEDLPERGFTYCGGDDRGYFYTRDDLSAPQESA